MFSGLRPDQLEQLADEFTLVHKKKGEALFSQGDTSDSFYIVFSGKIRVSQERGEHMRDIATLISGDCVGEESLVYGRTRGATVTAVEPTDLLRQEKEQFNRMLRQYPDVKLYLIATIECRRLARSKRFTWLGEGETIYLMARRHQAYLYLSLIKPVLLGWLSLPLFYLAFRMEWASVQLVGNLLGGGILLIAFLWGVWQWIDWGNDYYIVTNQRVVWLEKVIGLYDSRQEAPLGTVVSVNTQTDATGRMLGFGDVSVRTFTGGITMRRVGMPEQLAGLVNEQLARSKVTARKTEAEALDRAIRSRLGLPVPETPKPAIPKPATPSKKRPGYLRTLIGNLFKARYEESGIITFRKHWILLLQQTWKPDLGLAVTLALTVAGFFYPVLPLAVVLLVGATALTGFFGWWLYEYVDWRNDVYQLTADQIMDIEKKPFGPEDRKTALLENILSLEHRRAGLVGLLLNYGDVIAMVGGVKFTFDGVYDPAEVEHEIFQRVAAKKRRMAEAESVRERERMADWLAAYHRQVESMRNAENPPGG